MVVPDVWVSEGLGRVVRMVPQSDMGWVLELYAVIFSHHV